METNKELAEALEKAESFDDLEELELQHLLLLYSEMGGKHLFAARSTCGLRIAVINDKFDIEAEKKLIDPSSANEELKALGLKFVSLPFDIIDSIAYDDTEGGILIIKTRDKRYSYRVAEDYNGEKLKRFFAGITRAELPNAKKKVKADWREGLQKKGFEKWVKYINLITFILTLAVYMLTIMNSWIAMPVCALVWVLSAVFCVTLPAYCSLIGKKDRERLGYTTKTVDLSFPLVMAPLAFILNYIDDFTVNTTGGYIWLILIALAATASFLLIMHMNCKDFREHFGVVCAVLGLSVLFFFGAAGYINHYANFGAEYKQCTVTELIERNGRWSKYYCKVEFKDGTTETISVKPDTYREIRIGDTVSVYSGAGALGIEYSHIKP